MRTGEDVRELGLYVSDCCLEELLFDKDDSFSRCPRCSSLCGWELIETLVILAVAFTPKMEGTRLADAAINSDYWYFVVVTGLLNFVFIYVLPRVV